MGLAYQSDVKIYQAQPADYAEITNVWEVSVRATHTFLSEEDILFYKPLIPQYLQAVNLFCIRNMENRIIAFIGIADKNIEMLFIHPSERGKGLGRQLIQFAITLHQAEKVDVNEQNEQALSFYRKMGFQVVARDPQDSNGKPYPILHMQLNNNPNGK